MTGLRFTVEVGSFVSVVATENTGLHIKLLRLHPSSYRRERIPAATDVLDPPHKRRKQHSSTPLGHFSYLSLP